MSEQNPEQGMNYEKSFEEIMAAIDHTPLNEVVGRFDSRRTELYDSLAELAVNMPEIIASKGQSTVDLDGLSERMADVLRAITQEDSEPQALIGTTVGMMERDSAERVALMNDLLQSRDIVDFKPEQLKELIVDCVQAAASTEQAIENIEAVYHGDLSEDISTFVQLLFHKHQHHQAPEPESGLQPHTLEIKKDLKDHAADVAKIALGVTVALAFDRFIHKKS